MDKIKNTFETDSDGRLVQSEKDRISALDDMAILEEWGRLEHRESFKGVTVGDKPYATVSYVDSDGSERQHARRLFHLSDNYLIWLSQHLRSDGTVMTDTELNDSLVGRNMGEIRTECEKRMDSISEDISDKTDAEHRKRMLTVGKLIDYLKTMNPDACVVAYERNSEAYIEQWPDLPNDSILTVAEDKAKHREFCLESWYRGMPDAEEHIERDIAMMYRYCNDDDVIIKF